MKLSNPLKRARLNNVTDLPCSHGHLAESPHRTWRYAQSIGWFKWNDKAQEFLFDAAGPVSRKPFDGKPTEYTQVVTGPYSYIFCICCMNQATVDSIPGTKEPKAAVTGWGAHWHTFADPATLRHLKSYGNRIPTQPGAGKWVLPHDHVDEDFKFSQNDHAPIS